MSNNIHIAVVDAYVKSSYSAPEFELSSFERRISAIAWPDVKDVRKRTIPVLIDKIGSPMILHSIDVKNFRSILNEGMVFDSVTALVGANGTGKSSFLHALNLFYAPTPKLENHDFYNGETFNELTVAVTFKELSAEATALFSSYLQDGALTVERVFIQKDGKITVKYHGASLQCDAFQSVRIAFDLKDRGKAAKEAYEGLRDRQEFSSLPAWTTIAQASESLKAWEASNPGRCSRRRDDGQFFGFEEVAQGYLGKFTKFLFIPAVREASDDASEGRNSVFTSLMDLVVRSILARKEDLRKLKETTQNEYEKILDPANLKELEMLAELVSGTLKTYVPTASVEMEWLPLAELEIPLPKANVRLVEDGYASPVSRTGHGLQRAFILTMLQHLALAQNNAGNSQEFTESKQPPPTEGKLPSLALAIEEPELFQHPNRQRHLGRIFQALASGSTPGVAKTTQIVLATHSPLFIAIDRVAQIRLLRKHPNAEGKPRITKVISTTLDKIAKIVWEVNGMPEGAFTGATPLPRLRALMTPWMSEGFFADVAVLVEGEDDRAAILGVASALGHELESMGCSVIPCGGKKSLDRPASIFRELGIPVFIVWDGDKGGTDAKAEDNHCLLRVAQQAPVDWPISQVGRGFGCFEETLETVIRAEIGPELFDRELRACQETLGFPKKKHAVKNPVVIATIIAAVKKEGRTSGTLEKIVDGILELRRIAGS
jgi:putative ATP-dependent endonuclease of OLD family